MLKSRFRSCFDSWIEIEMWECSLVNLFDGLFLVGWCFVLCSWCFEFEMTWWRRSPCIHYLQALFHSSAENRSSASSSPNRLDLSFCWQGHTFAGPLASTALGANTSNASRWSPFRSVSRIPTSEECLHLFSSFALVVPAVCQSVWGRSCFVFLRCFWKFWEDLSILGRWRALEFLLLEKKDWVRQLDSWFHLRSSFWWFGSFGISLKLYRSIPFILPSFDPIDFPIPS